MVENPTPVPIVIAKPILGLEALAAFEGIGGDLKTMLEIVRMYALRPATALLLLDRTAGKLKPSAIEPAISPGCVNHPDRDRHQIGHSPKQSIATT